MADIGGRGDRPIGAAVPISGSDSSDLGFDLAKIGNKTNTVSASLSLSLSLILSVSVSLYVLSLIHI